MISVLTPSIRTQYLGMTQECLEQQTYQDFEWLIEPGFPARGFTLPSDFNKMLKRAQGDIIVILQDCITVPATALEEISKLNHNGNGYTYPVGKKQADKTVKYDWRKYKIEATGSELQPANWEIDFGSAPLKMFFDVGGFDEAFNQGWSWENVELAYRASLLGYEFKVSNVTEGVAFDHDKVTKHPFRGVRENNDRRATMSKAMADGGRIKLNFL